MGWFLFLALTLLLSHFPSHTSSLVPSCNHGDASALLSFKNSFNLNSDFDHAHCESSYPKTKSWENITNCCLWDGVSCDTKSGYVIGLDLSCSWLQGQLHPNNTLFQLTHLQTLNLAYNDFLSSPMPSGFGDLVALTHLSLDASRFGREIPLSLFNLQHVTEIGLSENNFTGSFPQSLGNITQQLSKLEFFDISRNNLVGQLPSYLFGLTQLRILYCSDNKLVGSIPDKIGGLPNLQVLDLSGNSLEGIIPHWCFSLSSLLQLSLSGNQLTGPIPEFSAFSLDTCDLSYNKLQGNIPESMFHLQNPHELNLQSNNMSGLVDFHSFSNWQSLFTLSLSHNNFLTLNFKSGGDYTFPNLSELYLSSCNIKSFPEFLSRQKYIDELDLSRNQIHGSIPKWFNTSLTSLDLSHNFLTSVGYLSPSWQYMHFIDLSFNMLEGDIPVPPSDIRFFSVSNNKFTGDISSGICNASSLIILNLSHNNLTGKLPKCIGTLPDLLVLDLKRNKLSGIIPKTYLEIEALETMNFNGNQLEGPLPRSVVKCKQLKVLDLGENNIQDTFPSWLDSLQQLQVLVLRANRFNGTINCFKSKNSFPKLQVFDISNNNISGNLQTDFEENFKGMMAKVNNGLQYIATLYSKYNDSVILSIKGHTIEMERVLTTFTSIDLSNNRFEGVIPAIIGELKSLKGLNLSHNRITGFIPQTVGSLENLEWLDLSSNMLTGEIPKTLTNLHFLSVLNLSQNQLVGTIPTGKQFDTFDNDSYQGNLGLCGLPLSKSCQKNEKQPTHSSTIEHHEPFGFGWKPVAIGYASGVVFGAVLGYVIFFIQKPEWSIKFVQGILNQRVRKRRSNANTRRGNQDRHNI